jgi:hypothetical protein
MGVPLGRGETGMIQQFMDRPQVRAVGEQRDRRSLPRSENLEEHLLGLLRAVCAKLIPQQFAGAALFSTARSLLGRQGFANVRAMFWEIGCAYITDY